MIFARLREPARRAGALCLLLALLWTLGCGVARGTRRMFGNTLPLSVTISPDANQKSPVAVDLVLVRDKKVLEMILGLSARDWFGVQRAQLARDFAGDVEVHSWEWVPGQQVPPLQLEVRAGTRQVVVFADYFVPGTHRAVLDPKKPAVIALGEMAFTVETLKE